MHKLEKVQRLPVNIEKAWDFFSSPKNLNKITPSYMNFEITSDFKSDNIYPGMFLIYKVSPMLGIPITWVTEITQISEKKYFIDEQRAGPYKLWHHEHHFREIESGIEMTDILYYKLPFGLIGKIINKLFVKRKVNSIFDYREKVLKNLFDKEQT